MRFCSKPVDAVVVMPEPKLVTRLNRTLAQASGGSGGAAHDSASQQPVPHRYGPRERIVARGPAALSDAELLAVCLGSGSKRQPVLQLAESLLTELNGLTGLFNASPQRLLGVAGMGPAKVAVLLGARALGERMSRAELATCDTLSSSAAVLRYVQLALARHEQEVFACLFLDTRHRLLHFDKLFFGSVDRANVYPREIMKRALTYNAAAIILAHNHPSGVAEPSSSDIRITATIKELMAHLDVRVLDHVVVAAGNGVSMAQRGLV